MSVIRLHIAADHPALPGHFPGRAIVPGVVVLDRVAAAIERNWGECVGGWPQVKFLAPLLPEQEAELRLDKSGDVVRFACYRGAACLTRGIAQTVAPSEAQA